MINKKVEYDDYYTCPKCENKNSVKITDTIESTICECATTCNICGHKDYWAYGFYSGDIIDCYEVNSKLKGEIDESI